MTDHAKTIREAMTSGWGVLHGLNALDALLAGHAAEVEQLRQQLAAAIEQDYCTLCGNALAAAQEPPAESNHCEECDDTGCLCWRTRDWSSIDNGCHDGCHYCGRNGCQPPCKGDDRDE